MKGQTDLEAVRGACRASGGPAGGAMRARRFNMEWTNGMTWKVCRQHTTHHIARSLSVMLVTGGGTFVWRI